MGTQVTEQSWQTDGGCNKLSAGHDRPCRHNPWTRKRRPVTATMVTPRLAMRVREPRQEVGRSPSRREPSQAK